MERAELILRTITFVVLLAAGTWWLYMQTIGTIINLERQLQQCQIQAQGKVK